jgi:hypothetical protein
MRVGQCGGCDLKVHFWALERAKLMCVGCGVHHEVEVDAALDLSSGERTEIVMLVPKEKENQTRLSQYRWREGDRAAFCLTTKSKRQSLEAATI